MVNEHAQNVLTQMEAYPFQKRLSEIMSTPVATCTPETQIRDIARKMIQQSLEAMLVCDQDNKLIGIVTERDLVLNGIWSPKFLPEKRLIATH